MRSVRCDRCGFVQAERATCRKCGYMLALAGAGRELAFGRAEEHERAVASGTNVEEPRLGFGEEEEARVAVGGGRRPGRTRPESVIAVPAPAEPEPAAVAAEATAAVEEDAPAAVEVPPAPTPEARGEPAPKKAVPEAITRIRSVPLTASLDATGHVMIEFQCRKCDRYGVLLVPPELMETGIEGECGSCHRSAPMTRVELEAKRFDRYEG